MSQHNISTAKFSNISYSKKGDGPVLILLPGFPEDHTLWQNITPALAQSFTVITPDIPGSGSSVLDKENVSMEELASSIHAIIEEEKIENMVLAGHSMGGYVALAYAEQYPSFIQGLSLIHSTATSDTDEKKDTRKKSIELIRKGGKEPFIKGMIPNLFSEQFRKNNEAIMQEQIKRGMNLKAENMIAFYNAMINRKDRTSILKNAKFPVQMIIGKEDTVVPMNIALQQSAMADVNYVSVYENCAHMSMIEQPQKLIHDLQEFTRYCFNR